MQLRSEKLGLQWINLKNTTKNNATHGSLEVYQGIRALGS